MVTVLMYHRLGTGTLPGRETGEERYAVAPETFEAHLDALAGARARPIHPARLLDRVDPGETGASPPTFCLTFDDGNLSDHSVALPLLCRRGWTAAFFVVPAFVGLPGYMSWSEVRELHRAGMAVGAHGFDHARLGQLSGTEVRQQLRGARLMMRERLGETPWALSLPGGSGGPRVVRIAKDEGFTLVATSVPRLAPPGAAAPLPRFALRAGDDSPAVCALAEQRAAALWRWRTRYWLLQALRQVLGERRYALVRGRWAGRRDESEGRG